MINWIITSSILLVGVIVLRRILRGRISLRLQYALWGLVLLRLLLPVSVGATTFSVENTVQSVPAVQHFAQRMASPAQSGNPEKPAAPAEPAASASASAAPEAPAQTVEPVQAEEPAQTEKPVREVKSSLTQVQIMRIVWLGGAALVGAAFAAANLRFALRLRRSRRRLNVENSRLPVYVSDVPESPCLFGIFRPAVYLTPETAQDATALRHALAHETTHFRHGDPVWSALRCVCLTLHWFNPLVWWAAVLSRRDAELACDEATVRTLGEEERAAYGRTLLRMTCRGHGGLLPAAPAMSGDEIKERILLLAKKPRTAAYTLAAVLLIAALAVGCTFTGAKEGEKPQEEPDPTTPPSSSVMTDPTESADVSEPDFNLPGTRVDAQTETEVKQLFESPKGMYSRFTATGCEFARYWNHNVFFYVDNQKLSKSLHNFFTVRDVANVYGYEPIRYFMLTAGYRMPLNYTVDLIESCKNSLERLYTCRENLDFTLSKGNFGTDESLKEKAAEAKQKFCTAMDDDLNTPDALAAVFDLVKDINTLSAVSSKDALQTAAAAFDEITGVLGLLYNRKKDEVPAEVTALVEKRAAAKKAKDWATADAIRAELTAMGWAVKDTAQGPQLSKL